MIFGHLIEPYIGPKRDVSEIVQASYIIALKIIRLMIIALTPPEKLNAEHREFFFWYALLRRCDAYEEHGDVFFWYALYVTVSARPRKSG